jgi:hypothetical protein
MYLASGGLRPHSCFLLSTFCFISVVALGRFGPAFIVHPSSFIIRFRVALVSHWGRFGVAMGCLSLGYQHALGWL